MALPDFPWLKSVSGAYEHPLLQPGQLRMDTDIHKFQAQFSTGFSRPNTFRVAISDTDLNFTARFSMGCFQAQIPGNNIATTEKDIGFRSVSYQKIYSDIILGFYAGDDMRELKFWQDWIDNIVDPETNYHEYYNNYKGTVTITKVNRTGDDIAEWKLIDAYPKQVDPIQLDYGTNDSIMTVNTTITYRYFTHEFFEQPSGWGDKPINDTLGKRKINGGLLNRVPRQNSDYQHYNQKVIKELNTFEEFRDHMLNDNVYDASKDPSYSWKSGRKQPTRQGNSKVGGAKAMKNQGYDGENLTPA